MMPMHPVLRRRLLKYIPELTSDDLRRYDSWLALRWELSQQRSVVPKQTTHDPNYPTTNPDYPANNPRQGIDDLIEQSLKGATNIIEPVVKDYIALHDEWLAGRGAAAQRRGLLQIPISSKALISVLLMIIKYYFVHNPKTAIVNKRPKPFRTYFEGQSSLFKTSSQLVWVITATVILVLLAVKFFAPSIF